MRRTSYVDTSQKKKKLFHATLLNPLTYHLDADVVKCFVTFDAGFGAMISLMENGELKTDCWQRKKRDGLMRRSNYVLFKLLTSNQSVKPLL